MVEMTLVTDLAFDSYVKIGIKFYSSQSPLSEYQDRIGTAFSGCMLYAIGELSNRIIVSRFQLIKDKFFR